MFRYELHCHTSEVSPCAHAPAKSVAEYYQSQNYAGIFITDHFVCGRGIPYNLSWEEWIDKYSHGYEIAKAEGEKHNLKVFFGFEYTCHPHGGMDFLVYGLDKEWLKAHPEIVDMPIRQCLEFFMCEGAFIVQAHPFRESSYIEMIRLLPRHVHGVEVLNSNRNDTENGAAEVYAKYYNLFRLAGTDNHLGPNQKRFCGIDSEIEITTPRDLRKIAETGSYTLFDEKK
ncbi:MAG: PHP domain-containing protein [Eubacteriales bacterium]|jgi:histidinol phosphatase-like PHP family hydrolase